MPILHDRLNLFLNWKLYATVIKLRDTSLSCRLGKAQRAQQTSVGHVVPPFPNHTFLNLMAVLLTLERFSFSPRKKTLPGLKYR
jgi:hypothetical protein